jgi:uncharacterized repeat protein (TIGR02543 family)
MRIYHYTDDWDESSVTWNNRPSIEDPDNYIDVDSKIGENVNYEIDITRLIQGSNSTNACFYIRILDQSYSGTNYRLVNIASSESSSTGLVPQLVLEYTTPPSYSVAFSCDTEKGSISGETSQTLSYGFSSTEVSAVSKDGYGFVDWRDANGTFISSDNPFSLSNVISDTTVYAYFIEDLNVSFITDGNGTISGEAEQSVSYGNSASAIKAVPNEFYSFSKWVDSNGTKISTSNPLTLSGVTKDITIKAVFAEHLYINFTTSGNGAISGSALQRIKKGSSTQFVTAVPDEGYDFVRWQNSDGTFKSYYNPLKLQYVQNDTTISAVFVSTDSKELLTVSPSRDAFIRKDGDNPDIANTNYGSETSLRIKNNYSFSYSKNYWRTLVHFSGVQDTIRNNKVTNIKEAIESVSLQLYHKPGGSNQNCYQTPNVYWNNNEWSESEVTWNNAPSNSSKYSRLILKDSGDDQDISFDVTDMFFSEYSESNGEAGFMIRFGLFNNGNNLEFASKEYSDEKYHPYLRIVLKSFNVSFLTDGKGTVSGETSQVVVYGSNTSAIEAVGKPGYQFVKWVDAAGGQYSTENPLTITNVTEKITLTAVFEEDSSTGIGDAEYDKLTVYPNPTTGVINIDLDSGGQQVVLSVYSLTGKLLYSNPSFYGGEVDLSELNKGIYILKLSSNDKTKLTKLIKK